MIVVVSLLVFAGAAIFAIYRWGRNSKAVDVLESDVKTGNEINEILEKQRDNRINDVGDADRLWTGREKD